MGEITQTDFGYTFQRGLPGTGLMDYRARFYEPALGRFHQPDSIVTGAGNPQSLNRYSYVGNDPITHIDPSGHWHSDYRDRMNRLRKAYGDKLWFQYRRAYHRGGYSELPVFGNGSSAVEAAGENVSPAVYESLARITGGGYSNESALAQSSLINIGFESQNEDNLVNLLGDIAFAMDTLAYTISIGEAILVDVIGTIIIVDGCATGVGCLPAIGLAIGLDVIWTSDMNYVSSAENWLGVGSAVLTTIAEYRQGVNAISIDQHNLHVDVGLDTAYAWVNAARGNIPEANYDLYVSAQQYQYDISRPTKL